MTGPRKGTKGRGPKKNTAQGRGGVTRDTVRPARERAAQSGESRGAAAPQGTAGRSGAGSGGRRPAASGGRTGATNPARRKPGERAAGEGNPTGARPARGTGSLKGGAKTEGRTPGARAPQGAKAGAVGERRAPPKVRKALPELKRVVLDAPAPDAVFVDRDGERLTFADSALKRVAARVLSEKRKAWRYRPFSFPLFTDRGHEQTFHFDFYIYDAEDSVIRLILVVPFESREVWDRVGRFKRQYPMYTYELWTPEKLAFLDGPRGRLEF
ncbi:hypothetical protein HNQ07_002756 [Deinococcus metalli]|uniref:Uncharacterized protein n=1 Tax=Deinococcus metalli TaxID=1141878 RepID=A0A7W8NRU8_9DEIO|nr:hypothetical protein [Deinococcus metalli]MBB5377283.1 hypothetical protein [Deinococcus metalli]GHF47642.1 hypothetical protein GCM10017781_24920 [Deinococcus metalli]